MVAPMPSRSLRVPTVRTMSQLLPFAQLLRKSLATPGRPSNSPMWQTTRWDTTA